MTQWLTNPTSIHEDEDKGAALKDKRQKKKVLPRVLLWLSPSRTQDCHCSGSGCCCGSGSTSGLGTSACPGRGKNK